MDFHRLSRKELQTLCKKNKIPANITNVAMADALGALQHVEGLDKLLDPVECDAPQFTEERVVRTPLTSCRTLARRKPVKEEPENSKVSTRLGSGTRGHDDNDLNVPATPAIPSSRRRAPTVSTRRKKETQKPEDEKNEVQGKPTDAPKTLVAPSSRTRTTARSTCRKLETPDVSAMQRVYSTRRSMKLLEKNLADMSLKDNEDMGPVNVDDISEEKSNVSKETENSEDTQKVYDAGASSHMVSTEELEKTDELEFDPPQKNTESESQSRDSKSELQLGLEVATDARVSLEAEPLEPFEEMQSSYECELHDLSSKREVSPETKNDTDELEFTSPEKDTEIESQSQDSKLELQSGLGVATDARASLETEPPESFGEMQSSYECELLDLSSKREVSSETKNDTDELEFTSPEKNTEIESQSQDSKSELQLGLEVAIDARASLETEPPESFEEMQSSYDCELHDLNSKQDAGSETKNDTKEVLECSKCDESDADFNKSTGKDLKIESVDKDCFSGVDSLFDLESSLKPENTELLDAMYDDTLSVELNDDYTGKVPDEDVAGLLPVSVNVEVRPEGCDNQDKNKEDEVLNISDGYDIHNTELLFDAKDKTDENNLACTESSVEPGFSYSCTSTGEHHGNMEDKKDPSIVGAKTLGTKEPEALEFLSELEESKEDVVKIAIVSDFTGALPEFLDVEKDQNSEHSYADPEEIAIAKEESHPPADETLKLNSPSNQICVGNVNEVITSTMTVPPFYEQKTNEIPKLFANQGRGQFICLDHSGDSEPKQKKENGQKIHKVKENLNIDELQKKSLRALKKMMRNLSIEYKTDNTDNKPDKQDVKRRTALQVLPENRKVSGKAQNDN